MRNCVVFYKGPHNMP